VLLYAGLRAISVLRELPAQARRWRAQQIERAAVASVLDALSQQLSGRFVRAQASAQQALEQLEAGTASPWAHRSQLKLLAHLLTAESAHSLRKLQERDAHLQAALDPQLAAKAPEAHEGALLRAVRWAVEDRDVDAARSRLAELPQGASRRIQALRLKLRVARLGGATGEALETARLLAKHGAFSADASRSIVRGLVLDALREAQDMAQLHAVWNGLDAGERTTPDLAVAAAMRANVLARIEHDATAPEQRSLASAAVRGWLDPVWVQFTSLDGAQQLRLAQALELALEPMDAEWLARLEQAQQQMPNNAYLQYLAGQACMQFQLWGKAQQLLEQASHSLRDTTLLRRCWRSLARLAEERNDADAAQAAWKKAASLD
jgi:HemY protein